MFKYVCLSEIETLLTDLKYTCTDNWVRNIHFRSKKKSLDKKINTRKYSNRWTKFILKYFSYE